MDIQKADSVKRVTNTQSNFFAWGFEELLSLSVCRFEPCHRSGRQVGPVPLLPDARSLRLWFGLFVLVNATRQSAAQRDKVPQLQTDSTARKGLTQGSVEIGV